MVENGIRIPVEHALVKGVLDCKKDGIGDEMEHGHLFVDSDNGETNTTAAMPLACGVHQMMQNGLDHYNTQLDAPIQWGSPSALNHSMCKGGSDEIKTKVSAVQMEIPQDGACVNNYKNKLIHSNEDSASKFERKSLKPKQIQLMAGPQSSRFNTAGPSRLIGHPLNYRLRRDPGNQSVEVISTDICSSDAGIILDCSTSQISITNSERAMMFSDLHACIYYTLTVSTSGYVQTVVVQYVVV
ncbi:hypothetical protein QAD02_007246 [Eretmocerus hayati]|uniref:Uncharacterized protein n=1 Tax=Eretmocerus hayati TaxID=131215 RepID=A0ACC2N5H3_9HYME|nr:hypothetical protein QAD02_007246 [Eretmocerus hayati]